MKSAMAKEAISKVDGCKTTEAQPTARGMQSRKRLQERLRRPHIMEEILKYGLALSAKAQVEFINTLDTLAATIRQLLLDASMIGQVEINQRKAWELFKGRRIGFVDGGVANLGATGSAPVAIRVGTYVVVPGSRDPGREEFDFVIHLVDELYETTDGEGGVYEDAFQDILKLKDAARIAVECAGLLRLATQEGHPEIVLLQGPLVNPVSPYALGVPGSAGSFPNYTRHTLELMLPGDTSGRSGRETNFVSVYLEQLRQLSTCDAMVCGVVERTSSSIPGPLAVRIIEHLLDQNLIDRTAARQFEDSLRYYRVTDSILFECVLDEGEFLQPVEMDKQGPDGKIPDAWRYEIKAYPKPLTTYVKASAEAMPVRVETFNKPRTLSFDGLMNLVVHTSRLLPRYCFPVGLDIVDKHAKIPQWMSKQVGTMLATQLMRKAMESGNPAVVSMVRRVLSANMRDWLYRPDYKRS